ncbi:hypothetical protein ACS0TY_023489 [Phlomoides rotata]
MEKEEHHQGPECCMCGDQGLSSELFTCKTCRFRLQHKYCSNLYPGAESYTVCNWCLSQKDDKKGGGGGERLIISPKSSHKITTVHQDDHDGIKMIKKKRVLLGEGQGDRRTISSNSQIKKSSKLPVEAAAGRRRVASDHAGGGGRDINIRRTRSEEMSSKGGNGMIIKQVFRNKVRRYKLLDDVSS